MRRIVKVDCDLCTEKHERQLHALSKEVIKLEDALAETSAQLATAKRELVVAQRRWAELVETTAERVAQDEALKRAG